METAKNDQRNKQKPRLTFISLVIFCGFHLRAIFNREYLEFIKYLELLVFFNIKYDNYTLVICTDLFVI